MRAAAPALRQGRAQGEPPTQPHGGKGAGSLALSAERRAGERGAGRPGGSAAVLCRKRSLFPFVIDALEDHDLPVEVVGVGGLLMTPEVADLVALLWAVQDPTRGDRLMRLLTGPAVRLGAADLDALSAWAARLSREQEQQVPREQRDHAPDTRDRVSIVEALETLPPPDWEGPAQERLTGHGGVIGEGGVHPDLDPAGSGADEQPRRAAVGSGRQRRRSARDLEHRHVQPDRGARRVL